MKQREILLQRIEGFYIEVASVFNEVEGKIMHDSKFTRMFRKKDYAGNIAKIEECKGLALHIDVKDIVAEDEKSKDVIVRFERALAMFNALCDAYINLQDFLKKKTRGEKAPMSQYKELMSKVRQSKMVTHIAMQDLSVVYTEYAEKN